MSKASFLKLCNKFLNNLIFPIFSLFSDQYPLLPLYSKEDWQPVTKTNEYYYERDKKVQDYFDQDNENYDKYEDYNSVYYEWTTTKSPPRSFEFFRSNSCH